MNERARSLAKNLDRVLPTFSGIELYVLARAVAHEVGRRGLDARLEADALSLALLVVAQQEQHAIFSADCSADAEAWDRWAARRAWSPAPSSPAGGKL